VAYFERFLARLGPLLRGEEIPFDLEADNQGDQLKPVAQLGLADAPTGIKLRWLPADYAPVPLDVTATGPRAVSIGARLGDRLTLAVGADPVRVRRSIAYARAEREAAGLDPSTLRIGLYATVIPLDDRGQARAIAATSATAAARFSVMHGSVTGTGVGENDAADLLALHHAYDMNMHGRQGSPQAAALSDAFVESFCIFGPPGSCVERLLQLAELGVDAVVVQTVPLGTPRETVLEVERTMAASVLPHLS
jgi:5,10-methylenetetrahydromethanopterin reductase